MHYTASGTSGDLAVLETVTYKFHTSLHCICKYESKHLAINLIKRVVANSVSKQFHIS